MGTHPPLLTQDLWLSEALGYPAFLIEIDEASGTSDAASLILASLTGSPAFYTAKVPTGRGAEYMRPYLAKGFAPVETEIVFRGVRSEPGFFLPRKQLVWLGENSFEEAAAIVDTTTHTRLHREFPEVATAVRRRWLLEDLIKGMVFGYREKGKLCGCITMRQEKDGEYRIGILVIAPAFWGRGFARGLVTTAMNEVGTLTAGTQLSNAGALALYQSCGMRLVGARYVLHRHDRPIAVGEE